MNILVVHNQYRTRGGEEQVVESEIKLLKEHGHEVFSYFRSSDELDDVGPLHKAIAALGSIFSWKTYRAVRQLIATHAIDVVHVHNTVALISPSVYYASWSRSIPVVQTIHNFRLLCPNGIFYRDGHICEACVSGGLRKSVKYGCYRDSRAQSAILAFTLWVHQKLGTWRRVNAYIALTPFNKEKLAKIAPVESIFVKPNFVWQQKDAPKSASRSGYAYVGRLTKEKGVWTLLKAFAQMPERELIIAGEGPEAEAMRAFVEAHVLRNVAMVGALDRAGVIKVMGSVKAIIVPSQWYEGFSLVPLEAYACDTPVLGSDLGNVAAQIEEGRTGYTFDAADPEALVACVRRFEVSPVDFPGDAMEPYTPRESYRLLIEIYKKALFSMLP